MPTGMPNPKKTPTPPAATTIDWTAIDNTDQILYGTDTGKHPIALNSSLHLYGTAGTGKTETLRVIAYGAAVNGDDVAVITRDRSQFAEFTPYIPVIDDPRDALTFLDGVDGSQRTTVIVDDLDKFTTKETVRRKTTDPTVEAERQEALARNRARNAFLKKLSSLAATLTVKLVASAESMDITGFDARLPSIELEGDGDARAYMGAIPRIEKLWTADSLEYTVNLLGRLTPLPVDEAPALAAAIPTPATAESAVSEFSLSNPAVKVAVYLAVASVALSVGTAGAVIADHLSEVHNRQHVVQIIPGYGHYNQFGQGSGWGADVDGGFTQDGGIEPWPVQVNPDTVPAFPGDSEPSFGYDTPDGFHQPGVITPGDRTRD